MLLEEHLAIFPNGPYAMHTLGFTRNDAGKPKEGLKILKNLVKLHPNYYPAYNHIGYSHLKLNEPNEAISFFKLFLEKDNRNPSAYDSYAEGLSEINQYELAIVQLQTAVLIDSEFSYGWKHLAEIYIKNGEPFLALKCI